MYWLKMGAEALVMAAFILALTELAKRNAYVAAVFIAFPLMTVLTVGKLYLDTGSDAQASKMAYTTFWLILASLAFFVGLYLMQKAGFSFWIAFTTAVLATVGSIVSFTLLLKRLGIDLMSNV
ncbi:MAG: hypothetical protein CMK06_11245 [Ponticaulis sp.]|nr:hypothetical protein [Ponticaulis sp.]|tara:strand:+ start:4692 stop:5060 length:369 start_codon:yes stop_codon:yes gene_type:complete